VQSALPRQVLLVSHDIKTGGD